MSFNPDVKESNDIFVWICAFVPIVNLLAVLAFQAQGVVFLAFIANIVLLLLDARKLSSDGFDVWDGWMILGIILLVPLYLFRRAYIVEGKSIYAIVWLVNFAISLILPALL